MSGLHISFKMDFRSPFAGVLIIGTGIKFGWGDTAYIAWSLDLI